MVFKSNVFDRLGVSRHDQKNSRVICRFWKLGKCTHQPCRFVHGESPSAAPSPSPYRRSNVYNRGSQYSSQQPRSNVYIRQSRSKPPPSTPVDSCRRDSPKRATLQKPNNVSDGKIILTTEDDQKKSEETNSPKHATLQKSNNVSDEKIILIADDDQKKSKEETICGEWKSGNCPRGDKCQFLHSWSRGDGFSMLGRLPGHGSSAVSGLSLSSAISRLYCGSIDGILQAWDCTSGEVVGSMNVGGKIKCMVTDGDWLYVGLQNMGKAWNVHSGAQHILEGPVGQVHALHIGISNVFAAAEDGVIWGWKTSADQKGNLFQPALSLIGHTSAVISLRSGAGRLFSGSIDGTIKVWDGSTFQCTQTLKGHDDAVTSLLCYSEYLLSCSLDKKIKVWGSNKEGRLEVVYTHEEAVGALALCGIGACGKDMLLCSWNNDSVGMYELPSFAEKGRMYSKCEVRSFGVGTGGMFFTGDASGVVTVWNLAEEEKMER